MRAARRAALTSTSRVAEAEEGNEQTAALLLFILGQFKNTASLNVEGPLSQYHTRSECGLETSSLHGLRYVGFCW